MTSVKFAGIDPGLVHTGLVSFELDPSRRLWRIFAEAIPGPDIEATKKLLAGWSGKVFIEAYRPRSHFGTDPAMTKAVNDMKAALPKAKVLNNTGVKQVVRQPLMELLGVWRFGISTHHQDLRSAARIGLYGALKDDELNAVLAGFVTDHIDGRAWTLD